MKITLLENSFPISSEFQEVLDLLSENEQFMLKSNSEIIQYPPGQIIYAEGDAPKDLLFLNTGKVKIYKKGVSGKNQIIRLIKPGWFFGYRALLAEDDYYQSTAEAFEQANLIAISQDIINKLIRENHKVSNLFIHILAADLAKSNEHTVTLTQKHLRGRLANAILILLETYGLESDGKTLSARMARGDLAELANMNIANTSRMIGEFAHEGLIEVRMRHVMVLNKKGLECISARG